MLCRGVLKSVVVDGQKVSWSWGPPGQDTLKITNLDWPVEFVQSAYPTITFNLAPGSNLNTLFIGTGTLTYAAFDSTQLYCPSVAIRMSLV